MSGVAGSPLERALLSAFEAVICILSERRAQYLLNKVVVGAKGLDKSKLLKSIGLAVAMVDFASPGVIICPAYVSKPSGVLPEAYIADAIFQRGILFGDDRVLPKWCDPRSGEDAVGRQRDLVRWINDWRNDKGIYVVPFLLIDEVAELRSISEKVVGRFLVHLLTMAEFDIPVAVRLTGTWSETPSFLYNRENKQTLHFHKTEQ